MTTKLICENILTKDHFLSATEQASPFIGQLVSNTGNTGTLRPRTSGDISSIDYDGTATSNGDTLTIVDTALCIFGDDFFIGATITFTSGANDGESKTVTDFAQATGTITWSGALTSTATSDTFTLLLPYATRKFIVELIASGDAGAATFKWSHNNGTTYLGRDDPFQAAWLAESTIVASDYDAKCPIVQASNGNIIAAYYVSASTSTFVKISSDNGITWGSPVTVSTDSKLQRAMVVLTSGRVLLFSTSIMFYSDDNGLTWSSVAIPFTPDGVALLSSGALAAIYGTPLAGPVLVYLSNDGGLTWSSSITAYNPTPLTTSNCAITQASNGWLVAVARRNESGGGTDWNTVSMISKDGGNNWETPVSVIDFATIETGTPTIVSDIDGILYVACSDGSNNISLTYSDDYGETWGASEPRVITLKNTANILSWPELALIDGHEIWCTYRDTDDNSMDLVRRGIWEAYSANACTAAANLIEQQLTCGAEISWPGYSGSAGDIWTFEVGFQFPAYNIITDSPSRPWRSIQDEIACTIVLDMGASVRHWVDGAAFFGCNLRTLSFQMNASDSWGSPSVDESISFDLATGTVDDVGGNAIQDTSLLAGYKDHALSGKSIRMTSGTDDTLTWEILDNVGSWIFLDTVAATNIAASDTFAIFGSEIAKTFTGGLYRFIRLAIPAQTTADGVYEIGQMVAGKSISLTQTWRRGFKKTHAFDIEILRTPHGGMVPVKNAERKRIFMINWSADASTREEINAVADYIDGKNIALITDAATLTDVALVQMTGDIDQVHKGGTDKFDFSITLEENL